MTNDDLDRILFQARVRNLLYQFAAAVSSYKGNAGKWLPSADKTVAGLSGILEALEAENLSETIVVESE